MAITSIGSHYAASATSRSSALTGSTPAAQAFARADQRIQQQRDTTSVQLSAAGRLQSAVADTQSAAKALSDVKQTDSAAGIRKTAAGFIKAYNNATAVSRQVTTPNSALAENSRARTAGNDIRRAVGADYSTTAALRDIGITRQQDGGLVIDQKKFDTAVEANAGAVRETLSRVGQQAERVTTQTLSSRGNVGSTVNTLTNRARELDTRQTEQQTQATAAQQTVTVQTNRINNLQVAAGIASYERIFSF